MRDMRLFWLLLLGVSLLYIALSRGVFLYGDDTLMFQVTEGMVERGGVSVTSPTAAEAAGAAGFTTAAVPGEDGGRYAKYGIGQSLAALPFYVVADLVVDPLPLEERVDPFGNQFMGARIYGTALLNAVAGGAAVALTVLLAIAVGHSRMTALVLGALLAGGTMLVHYTVGFLSEPLSALCLIATIYGLLRFIDMEAGRRHGLRWLLVSGFCAGLALATRLALGVALIAPGLWLVWVLWWWWRRGAMGVGAAYRAALAWGAPIAGWLAVVGLYNHARFGSVTETGYGDEAWSFTTPLLTGLAGLLVSPGRGALWFAPPLLLSVAGAVWFARRRPDLALVIAGMFVATLALYGRYYAWHGGGVWGARFLVPLLPLLLLPAAEVIERAWRDRRLAAIVIVVAVAGLAVTALSILVPFDEHVVDPLATPEAGDDALWSVGESPILLHLRALVSDPSLPDVAAVRYGSPLLAVVTAFVGLLGLWLLWRAARLSLDNERRVSARRDS